MCCPVVCMDVQCPVYIHSSPSFCPQKTRVPRNMSSLPITATMIYNEETSFWYKLEHNYLLNISTSMLYEI